ncbi:50S ribosome-binding GTPase [Candidatus Woesearchaeota archaeon]|nr:50S ribosome-binding GTPase [Candidatus Woesearchaeota archaeon]
MNFEKLPPVENSKVLLDIAFRKAREKEGQKKLQGSWLQIIKRKESLKLDIIKEDIVSKLEKILTQFPQTEVLSQFYIKLMKLTLEFSELKKSLGAVNWASRRIRMLHKEYISKINRAVEQPRIRKESTEFYGRVSSTLKQIDPNLNYLEESRKIMRTYPDIKDMFTVCIYGFPNVGKSTLLNKLSSTKAKTAAYAFTTKSINAGYMTVDGNKIQVLDLPGTLARSEKMNNIEMQAELVLEELAKVIIFVFDLSGASGYPVDKQVQLLKKIKDKKPLIYVSKTDLPGGMPEKDFPYPYLTFEELKEELEKVAKRAIKEAKSSISEEVPKE